MSPLDSKQREIAEVAVRLIAERGFGNTGVRDFAGGLGVSVRALYETVRTKEEILALVVEHWAELWRAELDRALALESDPLDRFRRAVTALVEFGNEHPEFSAVVYREQTRFDQSGRKLLAAREKERVERLAELITAAIDGGAFRPDIDAGPLAAKILLLVDTLSVRSSLSLEFSEADDWCDRMLDMVVTGYGPPVS